MPSARLTFKHGLFKLSLCSLSLCCFLMFHARAQAHYQAFTTRAQNISRVQFEPVPQKLSPLFIKKEIEAWFLENDQLDSEDVAQKIQDLYLQSGFPGVNVQISENLGTWHIQILEFQAALKVNTIKVHGGTSRDRYLTRYNLRQQEGQPLDSAQVLKDVHWIEQNYFLPLQVQYQPTAEGEVDVDILIALGPETLPTANLALYDFMGLSLTAGLIADNPLDSGQIIRAIGKRNNIPFLTNPSYNLVQDWEYTLSWVNNIMPIDGMSLGINHYDKVDFLYPYFNGLGDQFVWIRSFGGDVFSGFPIWADPNQRRYLRGVFNLSLIEDHFHVDKLPTAAIKPDYPDASASPASPQSLSKSDKESDLLLMPALTVVYSDIDQYRLPRNGNFFQGRIGGSVLDARFIQSTLTGLSYWTPAESEKDQWTVLVRSAVGSTFGANPPFYRGFLNTGPFYVRGSSQYSVTEKHALRLSEEIHYIYKPSPIEIDRFFKSVIGQGSGGFFDGWALDSNLFLDQGAYWRNEWAPRNTQLSLGGGFNFITPFGSVLGVDLATSVYPFNGNFTAQLRISAPLSFTLYSDWGNTNGFFLR